MANKNFPSVSMFRFFENSINILKNPLPFHHENFEKLGDTFQLNIGLGKSVIFSRDAGFAQYALQKNQRNYKKSTIQTVDLA
ncbi:MAG: cytochrome P450, partial [Gillisia sp.]